MLTFRSLAVTVLLAATSVLAQQPQPLNVAPVPHDPLELANGPVQVAETPQARSAAIDLLQKANQNADLRTPGTAPWTLRASFNASGPVLYTGSGEMEETWLAPDTLRWSVRVSDFSLTRTIFHGAAFDDRAIAFIPMRVHMLRDALFWPITVELRPLIRTATANWKGKEVTCILLSGPQAEATPTPGRRWYEKEYCIDPKSGLLQVWSEAPGIFVLYDYDDAAVFHGHIMPRAISIVEGGNQVLGARVESFGASVTSPDSFKPTQRAVAQGPMLSAAMRFPQVVRVAPGAWAIQPVIVHAILDEEGKVLDAELVENTGEALSKSALDIVKRGSYLPSRDRRGPLQREAFINVRFVSQ
ncbi:MAG TPA: energy transducer TonB [Candidatus Angelobacter sp.]